ncbi:adenosine receptor A2b [Talpa occidentalis]|uniref:adenosine receptor A2b n=1 Tax=Talpa occidentalis TaxID=50954 RepID=UPI00188EDCE3|nr:adenosine receptor A2b [Talpa occidentalis]
MRESWGTSPRQTPSAREPFVVRRQRPARHPPDRRGWGRGRAPPGWREGAVLRGSSESGGRAGPWAWRPPRGPAPLSPSRSARVWRVRPAAGGPRGRGAPAMPGGAHAAARCPANPAVVLTPGDWVYVALELAIAALSVAGNVLVCAAVGTSSTLQTPTNYFLVSLAAADVAVGLFAIPFAIIISLGINIEFYGCLFLACFVLVLTQSSIFSLLAVAVDRYLAICVPLRYKSLVTGTRARRVIAVLWVLAFGIGLTPFLGWNDKDQNCTQSLNGTTNEICCCKGCFFECVVPMSYMVYFNFFGCVLPPLLIMLVIYIKIFTVACKQLQRTELMDHSRTTLQREIHAAKSLAMIVGIFAMCWLPVHAINCITHFQLAHPSDKPKWTINMAILLSHANSVVNPIVYAYRNRDFRYTFHKIISRYVVCQTDVLKNGSGQAGTQPALDMGR